jgi:hypothetical protein
MAAPHYVLLLCTWFHTSLSFTAFMPKTASIITVLQSPDLWLQPPSVAGPSCCDVLYTKGRKSRPPCRRKRLHRNPWSPKCKGRLLVNNQRSCEIQSCPRIHWFSIRVSTRLEKKWKIK